MIVIAKALLDMMVDQDVAYGVAVPKGNDGNPIAAIVLVIGQPETDYVLDALKDIEKRWAGTITHKIDVG